MSIFLVHVAVPIVVAMLASLVRRADADPDARCAHVAAAADRRGLLVRPAAGPLRARAHVGTWRTARPWRAVTVLILRLAGAAVRAEARQGRPVPAGSEPDAVPDPITWRARTRWSGSSRRCAASRPTSTANKQALRHRHLLLVLADRPGQHAPVPARRRTTRRVPRRGGHEMRHRGHAGDHHRQAELQVRRGHAAGARSFSLQLVRRVDRAARRRSRATSRTGCRRCPGSRPCARRPATGERGSAGRSSTATVPSQLGLTTQDVALTVAGAMRGDRLPELRTTDRELTMRLAFRESDRQSVEDLARVPRDAAGRRRASNSARSPTSSCDPSDREIQRAESPDDGRRQREHRRRARRWTRPASASSRS